MESQHKGAKTSVEVPLQGCKIENQGGGASPDRIQTTFFPTTEEGAFPPSPNWTNQQ